jgi:hypothetical protein
MNQTYLHNLILPNAYLHPGPSVQSREISGGKFWQLSQVTSQAFGYRAYDLPGCYAFRIFAGGDTSVINFFGHELVLVSTPGITVLTCTDRSVPIGGEDLIELGGIC